MSQFNIVSNILNGRVFIVNRSALVGRWDAYFNYALKNSSLKTKYPTISISSAFDSYSGGTPSKANLSYWDGDMSWVSPKDFKILMLNDTEDHITEEAIKNSATTIAPKGSLLMVVRSGVLAHTIPVAITTKPMAFNQDVKAFIAQAGISTEFLAVYFQVYNDQLLPLIVKHSTTVQSINTVQLNTLKIPVLPSHLQEKAVRLYLDAVTAKKQKEQQAQALLAGIDAYLLAELGITLPKEENSLDKRIFFVASRETLNQRLDPYYFQEHFVQFTKKLENSKYPVVSLKHISQKITSGVTPLSGGDDYTTAVEGVPFIRSGNINIDGDIDYSDLLFLKPSVHNSLMKSSKLMRGDLMIAIVGATIGQVGIYLDDREANINQAIALVRLNTGINYHYAKEVIKSSIGQMNLNRLKRPVARANINLEEISTMKIVLPPIEKQNQIAEHIRKIRIQAKQLQTEAAQILADAKAEVERMILGE